jgi:hypothetical protein
MGYRATVRVPALRRHGSLEVLLLAHRGWLAQKGFQHQLA